MHRLGAEEPYMNRERRDDVLLQIARGRTRQARVASVLNALPKWTDRPFRDDQEKFDEALKTFKAADPLVSAVELRLNTEPGPVWRDFTPDERTAFTNWTSSLEKLEGYVNSYFPTDEHILFTEYVLLAIAIGSFVLPLLLSDESEITFPIHPRPVPLPPSMKPRVGPRLVPAAAARPSFRPSSGPGRPSFAPTSSNFSPILTASGAIPVKAEVMRPATAASPWRQSIQAPATTPATAPAVAAEGRPVTPSFRSFIRPLGPSEPISPRTAEAVASGTPIATRPSDSHSPNIYAKPRFRRE